MHPSGGREAGARRGEGSRAGPRRPGTCCCQLPRAGGRRAGRPASCRGSRLSAPHHPGKGRGYRRRLHRGLVHWRSQRVGLRRPGPPRSHSAPFPTVRREETEARGGEGAPRGRSTEASTLPEAQHSWMGTAALAFPLPAWCRGVSFLVWAPPRPQCGSFGAGAAWAASRSLLDQPDGSRAGTQEWAGGG